MSDTAAAHAPGGHHQELGFFRTYIFSLDHKMIGRQFLFMGLLMIVVGGLLAMLVRWQLAWPETAVPGLGIIPEPYIYAGEHGGGIIPPQTYNALFTMHATIMIFFVVMPIMVGTFGNFLIPLMIGAGDMAFPKLNMLSFWVGAIATVLMLASFFVPGGPAAGGWTSYATLSARAQYTGVEWGQHLWIMSLLVLGVSSLMGSINYITTIINMRAPGMSYFRMPLTVWSLFITAILLLLALPVLTAALAMLLFDRMLGTSFFLPEGGGEPLLWQHMFWFFGHPEVYIMILPAMGITSDIFRRFRASRSSAIKPWSIRSSPSPCFVGRLGPPHVHQRHESAARHDVHGHDDGYRGAFRDQSLQLAGHAVGRDHSFTTPMLFALAFVSMFSSAACPASSWPRRRSISSFTTPTSSWRIFTTWSPAPSSRCSRRSISGSRKCSAG